MGAQRMCGVELRAVCATRITARGWTPPIPTATKCWTGWVDDDGLNQTAKLQKMLPVTSEAGRVQTQPSTNFPGAKPGYQLLRARPSYRSTGGMTEIVVNYLDVTEAQTLCLSESS
jgi:hypothetical protein